jgi:hypothetical protein
MKKYYIIFVVVGIVCLLIIGLIYISIKNHNTSKHPPVCLPSQSCDNTSICTCNTGYICDGTCKAPLNPTYTDIYNSGNKYGCLLPYKSISRDENIVKNTCDLDPTCIGYYHSVSNNIATDVKPADCESYITVESDPFLFKTKIATGSGYTSGENTYRSNPNEYGCGLALDSLSSQGGSIRLCDLDPECVGYYSSIGEQWQWEAATKKLPEQCGEEKILSDHVMWKFYRKN